MLTDEQQDHLIDRRDFGRRHGSVGIMVNVDALDALLAERARLLERCERLAAAASAYLEQRNMGQPTFYHRDCEHVPCVLQRAIQAAREGGV